MIIKKIIKKGDGAQLNVESIGSMILEIQKLKCLYRKRKRRRRGPRGKGKELKTWLAVVKGMKEGFNLFRREGTT